MKRGSGRRGVSLGTIVMLGITAVVALSMIVVLAKLHTPGTTLELKAPEALDLSSDTSQLHVDAAVTTSAPQELAGLLTLITQPPASSASATGASATLTFGGTVAITASVRRSCYYSSSKKYDFDELFDLMGGALVSDLTAVSVEDLFDESLSMSDIVTPAALLTGLKDAGVSTVSLGFSRCVDKGVDTLRASLEAVSAAGLRSIGAYATEQEASAAARVVTVQGIKIAVLHFTDDLGSSAVKKLTKAGCEWMVPVDGAAEQIAEARAAGAEAVVVYMHWGKNGTTTVSKAQTALAQQLADAGADVIVGVGSRVVMPARLLTRADGGQTLCCYGLGTLMAEKRTDAAIAGMLLHLTFTRDSAGAVSLSQASYSPTYIWHYTQDGVDHYRAVISCADAPDGMSAAQVKVMKKALSTTQSRLGSESPLTMKSDRPD